MKAVTGTGTIRHIYDLQTFASGFCKREFVIEAGDGKYPQMIKLECVKDRTKALDGLRVGDEVEVTFDIRGSEYKDRFYVNLVAWKIEPRKARTQEDTDQAWEREDKAAGDQDDIPF